MIYTAHMSTRLNDRMTSIRPVSVLLNS